MDPWTMSGGLIAGTILGFGSSTPLGSINLWITDTTLARRDERLRWFVPGVIAADCIFAAIAAWGYHEFFEDSKAAQWLLIVGGLFLMYLGFSVYRNRRNIQAAEPGPSPGRSGRGPLQHFLLGALMCGTNPGFLMFWVFAINFIDENFGFTVYGNTLVLFLMGVACGDYIWFTLLRGLVSRGRDRMRPEMLARIRAGIAMAFMTVGAIAVCEGIL